MRQTIALRLPSIVLFLDLSPLSIRKICAIFTHWWECHNKCYDVLLLGPHKFMRDSWLDCPNVSCRITLTWHNTLIKDMTQYDKTQKCKKKKKFEKRKIAQPRLEPTPFEHPICNSSTITAFSHRSYDRLTMKSSL